ncbi:hypothetical protein P170DRAFT_267121 [Aspergillus steynii IBT 23096]|uniref:NACHT domain-containing protein n=1 Tax=Aspergillus steynii IBT 23096 TaxID=1392250 RepID=A0A2I2FW03_9EURO|nr:uncharacterized protein P170DRAFT_267121 [Aspergillus steynii IBT 23096]PLB44808.1 hypothetical protein P170DRAFT_267121 [Aspergillus steynii IBT 23096]
MPTHDDYALGWVCALALEMTAAIAMLDERHPPLQSPATDDNAYTLGSIAGHNVVIAGLPLGSYGTISATRVLSHMRSTFPRLEVGLMVGIGGGVPSKSHDIRLGDVVVSKPTGSCSGVVQYDAGKALQGGRFELTGTLNQPPQLLLTHLSLLQAEMMARVGEAGGLIWSGVQQVLERNPDLQEKFGSPGPDEDILFLAKYPHGAEGGLQDSCIGCDRHETVLRTPRPSMEPHVHYGIIASGDQVMKDSEARDQLGQELGILCFEMEAAGLMNQLPSLVVRGICDYADSHKNKEWQGYAALTAAVYSKLLLSRLKPRSLKQWNKRREMNAEERVCFAALFHSDPQEDKDALKRRKGERAADTSDWILDTNELRQWLGVQGMPNTMPSLDLATGDVDLRANLLWLYGNPGTGKSTMVITMAEDLPKRSFFDSTKSLAYFFCDSSSAKRRSAVSILRGLLYQLIRGRPEWIEMLYAKYEEKRDAVFSSFDSLWSVLMSIGADAASGDKYCIIDALDECEPESQEMLLTQLNQTFLSPNQANGHLRLHILLTSRPYPEIGRHLSRFRNQEISCYPRLAADLKLFVQSKVAELRDKNRYSEKVASQVSEIMEDKAEGTFLWVGIACTELASVRSRDAVQTLQRLPRGLHSLYQNLLETAFTHDGGDEHQTILQIMGVVAITQQPLSVAELAVACNLYPDEDRESRLNFTREDIELCRLMVIVQDGIVRLLHKSVRDFLLRRGEDGGQLIHHLRAHATLAYRCLDIWLDNHDCLPPWGEPRYPEDGFLQYASQYWGIHAHHAQSEFRLLKRHESFFRAKSKARTAWATWGAHIDADLASSDELSSLHLSAAFGIVGLVDFALDQMQHGRILSKWLMAQPRFDDNLFVGSDLPSPLQLAARRGHVEVMTLLLHKKVSRMIIRAQVVEEAAQHEEHGEQMMAILIAQGGSEVEIDQTVLEAAARNQSHGRSILSMLLDRDPSILISPNLQIGVPKKPVVTGLAMSRLAELYAGGTRRPRQPMINEEIIHAVIRNQGNGSAIMGMLLDRLGNRMQLYDYVLEDMCAYLDARIVQLLLSRNDTRILLTPSLISAAMRNRSQAGEMMAVLLEQCNHSGVSPQLILEMMCEVASLDVIIEFLDRQKHQLSLTQDVVSHLSKRPALGEGAIHLLLDRCQKPTRVVASLMFSTFGTDIVRTLLGKYDQVTLSKLSIKAISDNRVGDAVMKTVLLHSPAVKLGQGEIALICQSFNLDVIQVMLSQKRGIDITRNTVKHTYRNKNGKEVIMALLRHRGMGRTMPMDAILKICQLFDSEVVEFLTQQWQKLVLTPEVIHAGLTNEQHGESVMMTIARQADPWLIDPKSVASLCRLFSPSVIDQLPGIIVSEVVVYAAAQNFLWGRDTVALLLTKCNQGVHHLTTDAAVVVSEVFSGDFEITTLLDQSFSSKKLGDMSIEGPEDIASALVFGDANHISVLFDQPDSPPVTEDILVYGAQNVVDGKNVMVVLVDKFQNQLYPSSAVLEAAASNENFAKEVMEVLLDWKGHTFHIHETLVTKAAFNTHSGVDVIELLLHRFPQHLHLPEWILEAAFVSEKRAEDIITLLCDFRPSRTIRITPWIVRIASATNRDNALSRILSYPRTQVSIQREAMAAICQLFDYSLVKSLLSHLGLGVILTDDIIEAAAANCVHGKEVLELILRHQQPTQQTVEKALTAAAAADVKDTFAFLVTWWGRNVPITEDIICAAAGNRWGRCEVLSFLLDDLNYSAPITERVFVAAAQYGKEAVFFLLHRRGPTLVTDNILQAAANNELHGKYLLDQFQRYQRKISEDRK